MSDKVMTFEEAVDILQEHNKWRRGEGNIEMVNPKTLGIAIDIIITKIRKERIDNKTNIK